MDSVESYYSTSLLNMYIYESDIKQIDNGKDRATNKHLLSFNEVSCNINDFWTKGSHRKLQTTHTWKDYMLLSEN